MVSVNEKIQIQASLKDSPKAFAFLCYLTGKEINIPQIDQSETDKTYYLMLGALEKNNYKLFKNCYEDLSERKVLKEQPIIYDNYFLFVLINGIKKFNLNDEWIRSLINLRDTNNEPERSITSSFLNLLNKNYLTTDGISSIILASLTKDDQNELSSTLIRNSFESNKHITIYLEKDLFLVSIYLYTNDYIISISIGDDAIKLKKFESTFLTRINFLPESFIFFYSCNACYYLVLSG